MEGESSDPEVNFPVDVVRLVGFGVGSGFARNFAGNRCSQAFSILRTPQGVFLVPLSLYRCLS